MAIPGQIGMAIAWGIGREEGIIPDGPAPDLPKKQIQHMYVFAHCVATADAYIRNQCAANEVATVVAEDVPEMRKFLRNAFFGLLVNPYKVGPDRMVQFAADKAAGRIHPGLEFRISRIINTIHFVEKKDSLIILLADACAFGLRRYFSGQSYGTEFAKAMFGVDGMAAQGLGNDGLELGPYVSGTAWSIPRPPTTPT